MLNIIGLPIMIAFAALLIWSSIRAWRIKSVFLRWSGVVFSAVFAAVLFSLSAIAIAGLLKLNMRSAPVQELQVARTPEQIERGHAIAESFCGACHSKTGTLTGGVDIGKHLPIPVGSFVSANLTPVGRVGHWSDGDIFRAIRNGVDADGHWLMMMSYTNAGRLSDEDTQALIAYMRSQPPTGQETLYPPDQLNLLGTHYAGRRPSAHRQAGLHRRQHGAAKRPHLSLRRIYSVLSGLPRMPWSAIDRRRPGQIAPIGPDLSQIKDWSRDAFIATLRTGTDPGGHALNEVMPWRVIGKMDDDELTAVYEYLAHLPGAQATATKLD